MEREQEAREVLIDTTYNVAHLPEAAGVAFRTKCGKGGRFAVVYTTYAHADGRQMCFGCFGSEAAAKE